MALALSIGLGRAAAGEIAELHGHLAAPPSPQAGDAPVAAERDDGKTFVPLGAMPQAPLVPPISRIGLERTGCFGTCPSYTVVIHADGSFVYTGERYVERLGEHTGTVPTWLLDQVLRYIADSGFMALADTYESGTLDTPSAYLLVEWGDTTKVVLDHFNAAPATVWALGRLIDDLLAQATWE